MYKKINITTLIILFFILLIIIGVIKLIDYNRGDRTFQSDLISIDTSNVTAIYFYPKAENHKEVKLERKGRFWNLVFENKPVVAEQNTVKSMLTELANMKIDRIAATSKAKWKDYSVTDEEGVKVKIMNKDEVMADFIVGKFSYSQSPNPYYQRGSMSTYIRLKDDEKVYAVNGYMNILFNRKANTLRNGELVNVQKENINKLTFIYPGDSSFAMTLKDKKWMINEEPADSAKTANYFANITHLSSNEFADNFNLSNLTKPLYTIRIEGNNFSPIELRAYSGDAANRIVLTSSMNEGAKFSGDKNDLFRRVFVGRSKLSK